MFAYQFHEGLPSQRTQNKPVCHEHARKVSVISIEIHPCIMRRFATSMKPYYRVHPISLPIRIFPYRGLQTSEFAIWEGRYFLSFSCDVKIEWQWERREENDYYCLFHYFFVRLRCVLKEKGSNKGIRSKKQLSKVGKSTAEPAEWIGRGYRRRKREINPIT